MEVSPGQQLQRTREAVLLKASQVKEKDQGWRDLNEQSDQVTLLGTRLEGNALLDLLGDNGVYSGKATFSNGELSALSLDSERNTRLDKKAYRYSELEDGSKLYVAPSDDNGGHSLVVERPNGTIFIEQATHGGIDEGIASVLRSSGLENLKPEASPGVEGTPWLSLLGDIAANGRR